MSGAAHAIQRLNGKAPISIPDAHVSSPRLSYSEHSGVTLPPPNGRASAGDDGVVGKAVGMVSSAGAYLGLWNNGVVSS